MAHPLAATLEQASGIPQLCAKEESDIDVGPEDIDVAEWHILDARDGTAVMHQLPDIVATLSHPDKPLTRNCFQLSHLFVQPDVNSGLPSDRSGEPKHPVHNENPHGDSGTCRARLGRCRPDNGLGMSRGAFFLAPSAACH